MPCRSANSCNHSKIFAAWSRYSETNSAGARPDAQAVFLGKSVQIGRGKRHSAVWHKAPSLSATAICGFRGLRPRTSFAWMLNEQQNPCYQRPNARASSNLSSSLIVNERLALNTHFSLGRPSTPYSEATNRLLDNKLCDFHQQLLFLP
jgi:hypothetical protein